MATPTATLPLSLLKPSSKISSHFQAAPLMVGERALPQLNLRLNDKKMAPLIEVFPLRLYAIRASYLSPKQRGSLKLPKNSELLIEARIPELLGTAALAHWTLGPEEVVALAEANTDGGALLVTLNPKNKKEPATHRVLSPYWLDWQGWSGFARHVAEAAQHPDPQTLRYMAYELGLRAGSAPTGLHTARAYLFTALDDAAEAAAACQEEIALNMASQQRPGVGALEALLLMGKLLKAHGELPEARAAFSLALWLNPNQQEANAEIVPLLEEERALVDVLARLAQMPQRLAGYNELVAQAAARLDQPPKALQGKVKEHVKASKSALFAHKPDWLTSQQPSSWLYALGF